MEDQTRSSTDILQTASAIAAIAIALATLTEGHGPSIGSLEIFTTSLLLGGFLAVVSSLYAMGDVVKEHGGTWSAALGFLTVALYITGIAYIAILFDLVHW